MPKPPKKYYSDEETKRLIEEYTPYLKSFYVPTDAVRGIIRGLLEKISIPHLNREAAEEHLMADLLHDNRELEAARERSKEYQAIVQSEEELAQTQQLLAGLALEDHGPRRVARVLQEYSGHSVDRMRQESDEILKAIDASPFEKHRTRTEWANATVLVFSGPLKRDMHVFRDATAIFSGHRRMKMRSV